MFAQPRECCLGLASDSGIDFEATAQEPGAGPVAVVADRCAEDEGDEHRGDHEQVESTRSPQPADTIGDKGKCNTRKEGHEEGLVEAQPRRAVIPRQSQSVAQRAVRYPDEQCDTENERVANHPSGPAIPHPDRDAHPGEHRKKRLRCW